MGIYSGSYWIKNWYAYSSIEHQTQYQIEYLTEYQTGKTIKINCLLTGTYILEDLSKSIISL